MSLSAFPAKRRPLLLALLPVFVPALLLGACSSDDDDSQDQPLVIPAAPQGLGTTDSAAVQDETQVPPFIDNIASNQRGDARYATLQTNAGVRVVSGFLDIWQPSTLLVDAGASAPARDGFAAVAASSWSGLPGDATDGKVLNAAVHAANVQYVVDATARRTPAQELAAYLDDRRGKGYSISDGMGPLTTAWRTLSEQSTTITDIGADATTVLYNDKGNDIGNAGSANSHGFGAAIDLVSNIGNNASTEPAKRFYKYARPWRWSASVKVVPALEPAKSGTPTTDGGFVSGHSAEAVRKALAMAYLVPERYQEMVTRALVLGENRIYAGMHSPLDVIGGRIQGVAAAAANLATDPNKSGRQAAYDQARTALMGAVGAKDAAALQAYAHSLPLAQDPYADYATNKATVLRLMTFGLAPIAATTKAAVVPKGAEVLLETRLPYLSADQRRVVLKTTALASGTPVMDDAEGWGRLNLFAAADGYGAFDGDVSVTMDAARGGFQALDAWRNDIRGAGKLTKLGSGTLALAGANAFTGGTQVSGGVLRADSAKALGTGDVYVDTGTLMTQAATPVAVVNYTQLATGALELHLGAANAGSLAAAGNVVIAGGTLTVKFQAGTVPRSGDTVVAIQAATLKGKFDKVVVEGFTATPTYTATGLQIRIN
ncbi:phosphatase PAP2 family protein [Roseateles sp. 22389]|uniref:phosphatase PAP2 family protein n=1 Tax=Roseateles sp. 22389 TaxID=3453916 RepID=UPI003F8457BD